jgi:hypothetical protein
MYGKHWLASVDSSQLAKKTNQRSSDIDQSSFSFLQNCGACHPGGGFGEYDRKKNLYYNEETKKSGYEISGDDPILDGDYTPISAGNPNYGAPWDKSGVSEADCLVCHLKGYQWKERAATLKTGFFRWAPTVGVGWATLKLSEDGAGSSRVEEGKISYTRRETADFENLHLQIVRRPPDENCWSCHAASHGKRRGSQWSPETDVHKSRGLDCVSCHPGDKEHNLAKGNTIQGSVRDDLDHTMDSCEDCHYKGKDKKAPRYKHPFSPRHMKRIACQTCHIPFREASADLVYDLSTGSAVVYETSKFLSGGPNHPKKSITEIGPNAWYPTLKEFKGRIVPVKSLVIIFWGDVDETTNVVEPIFQWKLRGLEKAPFQDNNGDGIPEINTLQEIKTALRALKGKDKFGNPVAVHPVLMKGGYLYQLDGKGEVEKIKQEQALHPNGTGQAATMDLSLSHNIVSGSGVIGSQGCKDCHSKNSSFFLRKSLVDPYDEKGEPVYVENWERLGIDKEKLDRLLTEQ